MSKALFGVAQPKQNKSILIVLLLKEVLDHVNNFFSEISSFKHDPLFKISIFAIIFLKVW